MTRLQAIVFFIGSCLIAFSCTKPTHIHAGGDTDALGPLVQEVRLTDTISPSFTRALHLDSIKGSAFHYPSGDRNSYFIYEAGANEVLAALSMLPFSLRDRSSDVNYHALTTDEWIALRRTVGSIEISGATFFWDVDPERYFIIASEKSEHHLLLMEKDSRRILHRIASKG